MTAIDPPASTATDADAGTDDDRLTLTVDQRGRWAIIAAGGELSWPTAPTLEEQLAAATSLRTPPRLALELSQLESCDSSGLNLIVQTWKRTVKAGGQLILLNPRPHLRRMLQITGLEHRLTIASSVPE